MDSGKSIWIVLLALLGVTLLWLYATGKGQAIWTAAKAAYNPNAPATPAPGASSGAIAPNGSTNAYTPSVPQLVNVSNTQAIPTYIPAVNTSTITQQIAAFFNPATLSPVSAQSQIPTYISAAAQPAYSSNPLLGYGYNFAAFAPPTATQSGNAPVAGTTAGSGGGFLAPTTTPGFNPDLSYV